MSEQRRKPFAALAPAEFQRELAGEGCRPFVARQVLDAVYRQGVRTFDEITNVKLDLRRTLARRYALRALEVLERADSADGSFKLALQLADGHVIECALLAADGGGSACISSQVGCAMGCLFCASGEKGLVRNLEPYEMIEQVLLVRDQLGETDRLSHVTVMGIGEPLANLDNVLAALERINASEGLGIGARKIAVSTCGLPDGMRRLADHGKQYHLAVSLHAPSDELRARLMPGAARAAIAEMLDAARYYARRTTRKVAFEYVLVRGLNDGPEHAEELGRRLGNFPCMVNLIPLNEVDHCPGLSPPSRGEVRRFREILERAGLDVAVRRRRGAEVHAACGQLRRRAEMRHQGERSREGRITSRED